MKLFLLSFDSSGPLAACNTDYSAYDGELLVRAVDAEQARQLLLQRWNFMYPSCPARNAEIAKMYSCLDVSPDGEPGFVWKG